MEDNKELTPGENTEELEDKKPEGEEKPDKKDTDTTADAGKKYSDDDVNEIVSKKFKELKSQLQSEQQAKLEAIDEAKKLEQMNEQQRKEYEQSKELEELKQWKSKAVKYEMGKEVSKMAREAGITLDEAAVDVLALDTAEATQALTQAFLSAVEESVAQQLQDKLKGKAHRRGVKNDAPLLSKEELKALPYEARIKFQRENPEDYNKILKRGE